MLLSTTKTERISINALESIIDSHTTMDYIFNSNDKEMSWDGYILLFKKDNGEQSKANLDGRISVQIKGHNDAKQKYINRYRITYPVDLDDLRAYSTEKGVLYFQIFIYSGRTEIFYASLFPSKIADYLDSAEKRGNTKSINIPFIKMEKDSETLYVIVKQFHNEATKQGSVYTPLVQDRIKIDDFSKLKSITLSVVGAENPYSTLLRLSSGDVCLYGKIEGDKYFRPMEWADEAKFFVGRDVHQSISIADEVFYSSYRCIADSNGRMILVLSPNLELDFTQGKINFKNRSKLKDLYRDASFVMKLKNEKSFCMAGHKIEITNINLPEDFEKKSQLIFDLYKTLEMIGFTLNSPIAQYTDKQYQQLTKLVNLRLGAYNNQLAEGYNKYLWMFGDKCVPLLIIKNGNSIELVNSVYTDKYAVYIPDETKGDQRGYRMPLFVYQGVDILSNLYFYDYDAFYEQIDSSDINEVTSGALIMCVLTLINVFDKNGDTHFLDLAEYLLQLLEPFESTEMILLNKIQIKKRRGSFEELDIEHLEQINCNDIHVLFGKNVLLENAEAALTYFQQFPSEEQETYMTYPIYKLFEEIKL